MRAPGALWTSLHVLGWALYLGGAATMEVVWRPAQRDIPPGQTAVLCQRMGLRYRWLALSSLVVIAVSGVAGLADLGYLSTSRPFLRPPLVLSSSYGRTMLAGAAGLGMAAGKLRNPLWSLTIPLALAVSGAAFLVHEQNDWLFSRSAFVHHACGWVLLASAGVALALTFRPRSTALATAFALTLVVIAVILYADRDVAPVFGHLSPDAGAARR